MNAVNPAVEQALEVVAKIDADLTEILDRLESENREPTGTEKLRIEILQRKLDAAVEAHNRELELSKSAGRKTQPNALGNARHVPGHMGSGQPAMSFIDSHGNRLVAHAGTGPIAAREHDASPGEVFRALLLNDGSRLPANLQAAVHGGSGQSGGFLLTPSVSSTVIDLARAASVALRAGVVTLPVDGDVQLTRINRDPETHWRSELQSTPSSAPLFGAINMRPKMLSCIVPVSIETLEDSLNAGQVIEMAASRAMAAELDRAILVGAGTSAQPLGIALTSGVNVQANIGAIEDYSEVTRAIADILSANFQGDIGSLAWVQHPLVAAAYDGLTIADDDLTPLRPTEWASQLQRLHTTGAHQVASPNHYTSIIGAFNQCVLGARYSGVVAEVLDSGSVTSSEAETINAVSQFARILRLRIRVDVAVLQPGFFSVLTGISV